MRQATLVAFYGQKRGALGHLLRAWRDQLDRSVQQIGAAIVFRPYPLAQVHATVLGLESLPQPALYNRNMLDFRGELRAMRLPELFGFILESGRLPFDAQFGGFEDCDYPFRSRRAALRQIVFDPGQDRRRDRLAGARGPRSPLERP